MTEAQPTPGMIRIFEAIAFDEAGNDGRRVKLAVEVSSQGRLYDAYYGEEIVLGEATELLGWGDLDGPARYADSCTICIPAKYLA